MVVCILASFTCVPAQIVLVCVRTYYVSVGVRETLRIDSAVNTSLLLRNQGKQHQVAFHLLYLQEGSFFVAMMLLHVIRLALSHYIFYEVLLCIVH